MFPLNVLLRSFAATLTVLYSWKNAGMLSSHRAGATSLSNLTGRCPIHQALTALTANHLLRTCMHHVPGQLLVASVPWPMMHGIIMLMLSALQASRTSAQT